MQKEQEPFYNYIMECVQSGEEETAKAMLLQNFERQLSGTFTGEDLEEFSREIVKILKPERKDEVIAVMNQFGDAHVSK